MKLECILQFIAETDDGAAVDWIFDAAFDKKRALYPDWRLEYLAIPKDNHEGYRQEMEQMMAFMEKQLASL